MLIKITKNFKSLLVEGKYSIKYKLGEITKAPSGTVGIFCYIDIIEALYEMHIRKSYVYNFETNFEMWGVMGIGEPKTNISISRCIFESRLDDFYRNDHSVNKIYSTIVSKDVVCYPEIKLIKRFII